MEGWRAGVVALAGLCTGLVGCFSPPPEAQARLAALEQQGRDFDAALDGIEERMLGSRAMVSLWEEMAWRHRSVSAIACENAAGHVAAMEKHLAFQDKKSRKMNRQRRYQARTETVSAAGQPQDGAREN